MDIDTDIQTIIRKLRRLQHKAFPNAVRKTLNTKAALGELEAKQSLKDKLIIRNHWTAGSIKHQKAFGRDVDRMVSMFGSISPYMVDVEYGGTKAAHTTLATKYAAGQSKKPGSRTKLSRTGNRLKNIDISKKGYRITATSTSKRHRQLNAIKVKVASRSSNKFVYLNHLTGKTKAGIFKVIGTDPPYKRRKPRKRAGPWARRKSRVKVRLIHDDTDKQHNIPSNPWLRPASEKVNKMSYQIFKRHLTDELNH